MVEPTTAYSADRAAALAGVPKSTAHYWDRTGVLLPSVSPDKVKLWSLADLMGLRTVAWLRRRKLSRAGHDIPASTMPAVRRALESLRRLDLALWSEDAGPSIFVDASGEIIVPDRTALVQPVGRVGELQHVAPDVLDLFAPFSIDNDVPGPNLKRPRPHLRIVPGKLAGEPHIESTRLQTLLVHALAQRGFSAERIAELYPFTDAIAISEAIDLERQLHRCAA